jgi:hypothetical protein
MPSAYLNISDENHAWLAAQSAAAGLSMAKVADAILSEARRQGWQVTSSAAQVVQPLPLGQDEGPLGQAAPGAPAGSPPRAGRGTICTDEP